MDKTDVHTRHCCLEHGCKYGDDGCTVANGSLEQEGLCERCGLETEGYYGEPERTEQEQRDLLKAMWEERQHPKRYTDEEKFVLGLAKQHGRRQLRSVLLAIAKSNLSPFRVVEILDTMKHIA